MNGTILLSVAVLLPAFLVLWWRSHGPLTFMSVCLGYVLMMFTAPDVADFLTSFVGTNKLLTDQWVKIGLLIVAPILTLIFTIRSVKKNKLPLNFIPAVGVGMLFVLFLVPLLPSGVQRLFTDSDLWVTLVNMQTNVLLGGGAFSLLYLFVTNRERSAEGGKKEKHK